LFSFKFSPKPLDPIMMVFLGKSPSVLLRSPALLIDRISPGVSITGTWKTWVFWRFSSWLPAGGKLFSMFELLFTGTNLGKYKSNFERKGKATLFVYLRLGELDVGLNLSLICQLYQRWEPIVSLEHWFSLLQELLKVKKSN